MWHGDRRVDERRPGGALLPVESLARILVLVEVAPVLEARHSRTPRAHPDVTLQSMDSSC
jgi:hypothetical protein